MKIFFVFIALFFLSGCATMYNPATGRNEFIMISSQTETALGKNAAQELARQKEESSDPLLKERVKDIGAKIAIVSDRTDIAYQYFVLQDKELNAFTLPGGFIYINDGLAKILNDDELAFVLAHETGHVAARHIAKKIQSGMAYSMIMSIALASLGDGSGSGAQSAVQGADLVFGLVEKSYSRQDEYQADRIGVKYSYRAGYVPSAAVSALEKIKKEEGSDWKLMRYFRTHPYVDERVTALEKIIPEVVAEGKTK